MALLNTLDESCPKYPYKDCIDTIIKDWKNKKLTSIGAILKLSYIGTLESKDAILRIRLKDMEFNKNKDKDKKITTLDVIAWRDDIEKLINDIRQYPQNRFTSLVITKLEEAQMWAGNLFSKGVTNTFNIKRGK